MPLLGLMAGLVAVSGRFTQAADEIPLRNIDGALCIKGVLRTAKAKVPAFVVLDLGTRGPLLIHTRTAGLLGIQKQGPVDLIIDGSRFAFVGIQGVAQPLEPLETLTRDHAEALEDIPAVAVLGMPAFAGKRIELDVGAGRLRVSPRGADGSNVRGTPTGSKAATLSYKGEAYGYWLEAEVPATPSAKLRARLATSEYDTRIDAKVAQRLGSPGGDLKQLMLGPINLAEYTVLRPSDLSGFPEPRPDVILGTHLLSSFLAIVDPDQQQLTLSPIRPAQPALEERQFFVASARSDAGGVEAFLEGHRESRLAPTASETLLALRLAALTSDRNAIQRALRWRARTARPERRAMTMVQVADELIGQEKQRRDAYDLASIALDVGKPYAADDLNATAIHHINARRGLIALVRKDYTQARRDLLSAAFGIPKDPYVNLWLGQLYERTHQLPRAWSRYLQASLREQPPVAALRGLDRLNRDPAFRSRFNMTDAERLLEGRVPAFVPTRRYQPTEAGRAAPVHLVESFINQYDPATQAAQLAVDGLEQYLALAGTVFVQYHVGDLLSADESDARAAFYGVQRVPAVYFDGSGPVSDGGDEKAASRVFSVYRQRCIQERPPSKPPALRGTAMWQADNVQVRVQIDPGEGNHRAVLHAFLCERTVMAIGANGQVLHRHVVRAGFTLADGWPTDLSGGSRTFSAEVGLWATRQRLEQRLDELARKAGGTPPMRPTWIDRGACDVVVFLQDPVTRRVLTAIVLPVRAVGDKDA
jgi:hypothetical protein